MATARGLAALGAILIALGGCSGAAYIGQAALGQARLLAARRPLEAVLADNHTDAALAEKLRQVRALRGFAAEALGMQNTRGFDSFVATGRDYAVWNVVASPEFSLEARTWCFPVAGCVSYRGYFNRAAAEQFAARMSRRGFDTHVYGVAAYSTLGWFDDPVLDTWVRRRDIGLAALIFHELAHQLVYVRDDTQFSEAFARVVEREGVRRWLEREGRLREYQDYREERRVDARFGALLESTAARLKALYETPLEPEEMRQSKAAVFEQLRHEYASESGNWPRDYRFDGWMSAPLNNARLASVANYERWVVAISTLLSRRAGDLEAFYADCRELAQLDPIERNRQLLVLASAATMNRNATAGPAAE